MKRGGVGACFRVCQQPWEIFADGRRVDERLLPGRQISRTGDVRAYADAGVRVLKLQGRSLPVELLTPLVRRYREAIDSRVPLAVGALPAALPEAWTVVGR
jgi:collagenase-like PrtC family protease